MKLKVAAALVCVLFAVPSFAQVKACEELKMEIAMKIEANGVKNYELTIVPAADVKPEDMVVGSCDGGKNKIVYKRK